MTIEEMHNGYQKEVEYQKHMLKNIGYWFQLVTAISGIGIVLIYFFHSTNIWIDILGIVLFMIGFIGMMLFGYTGWKGQQNLKLLINDYEDKLNYLNKHDHKSINPNQKVLN